MADFVLINPPRDLRAGARAGATPNLGLLYVAAYLRGRGLEVAFLDAAVQGWDIEKTAEMATRETPLVCGLSATSLTIPLVAQIAAQIKMLSPDCTTVVGGPHISSLPETTLDTYRSIDYGVLGEGEVTALELYVEVERGGDPAAVPGVAYRDGGVVRIGKPRAQIKDLDSLPLPAWDLVPDLALAYHPGPQSIFRLPSTILSAARGCPYRCGYCDRGVFGRRQRMHGAARLMEMMEYLYRQYSIVDFSFHDQSLLMDEGRLVELCRRIQRSALPLSFSAQCRADQKITPFALRELPRSGCWRLTLHMETGDDKLQQSLGAGTTVEQAREALKTFTEAGISTSMLIMAGVPGETKQTMAATRRFVLSTPINDVKISFYTPLPAAELGKTDRDHGQVEGGYDHLYEHAVKFVPQGLTARQLIAFRRRLYRRFYLRPRTIGHYWRRLREPSARPLLLQSIRSFIWNSVFSW